MAIGIATIPKVITVFRDTKIDHLHNLLSPSQLSVFGKISCQAFFQSRSFEKQEALTNSRKKYA